jgi:hypothetical protein
MWQNIRYDAIFKPTIPGADFPIVRHCKPQFGWRVVVGEQVIDLGAVTFVGDGNA